MEPMKTVQGKVPLGTYRKFLEFRDRNGMNQSSAIRELLAKALSDESVIESIRSEHRKTRKQMEWLTELVAGNIASKKPLAPERVKEAVAKIAKKTESME